MNLIDAIKSGKPYRRKSICNAWYNVPALSHSIADILADDWEIEESTVQVTCSQFWEAANLSFKKWHQPIIDSHVGLELTLLARKLGLEP